MAGEWHVSHCHARGDVSFVADEWCLSVGANTGQIGLNGIFAR